MAVMAVAGFVFLMRANHSNHLGPMKILGNMKQMAKKEKGRNL